MTESLEIRTTDYHTAGEPFRIVTSGTPDIPGATVPERREYARGSDDVDRVRRLLVQEPRGHADMYGCFVVPPNDDGADFGTLFWHKDGYSTACGHGTIALGAWAIEEARRRGCALVQLTSDKRRAEAHRFYGRLGFAATHEGFKLRL